MRFSFLLFFLFASIGLCDGPSIAPAISEAPQVLNTTISTTDFLTQVLEAIKTFGGVPWVLKISMIITIAISSMKVTFMNELVWQKLGNFKAWLGPLLGLIAGVLQIVGSPKASFAEVMAWLSAGAGAIILHELLDSLKSVPAIGPKWLELIDVVSSFLGGPKKQA